jgi:hypothetical protein
MVYQLPIRNMSGYQSTYSRPIVFENLIKCDLIYVNDILDATKTLSSKFILEKLKFKSNWIAEFNIVKKSFVF